jgi:NADPH oxidase 2
MYHEYALKIVKYYLTFLPEIIIMVLWIGTQCFLFANKFSGFKSNPSFQSTNALIGSGLALAKASAIVINFNCSVLIITMCTLSITWLRKFVLLSHIVPFERHGQLHRLSSISMLMFSIIHTIAHYNNFSKIPTAWHNLALLSGPGASGHVLWITLSIVFVSSIIKVIRSKQYEVFWYLHFVSFLFLLVLSIHGAFCFIKRDSGPECPGANTWKWLIGPVSIFILELFIKTIRRRRFTFISRVILHQSDVVEIQMKKPSFRFKPGQYMQINCPSVSILQWHPFTVTSAPEESFISIHLRIVGDWTRRFAQRLGVKFDLKTGHACSYAPPPQLPDIFIDGPYGSISENYEKFEVAICIGAGIGQTPFSSILKSMWYSVTHPNVSMKLKKVIYVSISREIQVIIHCCD